MEMTGRNSFKAGEKLGVHSDGSVTTTTEHNGASTEERYNRNKTRETKVTQPNGDYNTTYRKADGSVDHSIEHTNMNGSTFESKKNPDGKVTETSRLDADGKLTTTKFQENGNASEKTVVANGVSTTTKFQENGATPTEKTIAQDGKTLTRKYAANGIDTTETIEKGADGLSTATKFDATTKQKTEEHKEKANGYVDTTFKNGKEVQKTDRTYGPNDSYTEIQTTAKTPQGADERVSTRQRGETGPDGKFRYTEKNRQGGTADDYDMIFDKDGKNGVGTRSRQTGGRGGSHTVNEYYYNGTYSEKAPPNQAQ